MENVKRQLSVELKGVAQPYLTRIKELEQQARNKCGSIESLRKEVEAKRTELQKHNDQSGQLLAQGKDPRPALQEAAKLQGEIDGLESFTSKHGEPDKVEQEEISRVKDDLFRAVHNQISESKILAAQSEALLAALRQVVKVYEDWNNAVESACSGLGIDAQKHRLLEFRDDTEEQKLAGRIAAITDKYAYLWNR